MTDPTPELEVPTPENPLRDVKYLAEATGYRTFTIREWLRDGKIRGRKDTESGEWKVLHSDFVKFCQEKWGSV